MLEKELYAGVLVELDHMAIAQDEIEKAQKRHGESGQGPIWQAFVKLRTIRPMRTEFVYRSHCIELLERVAAGEDLRPATRPEMVLALARVSKTAPMNSPASGLYMELFAEAFPEKAKEAFAESPAMASDYRRVHGERMDEYRTWLRNKLRQEWRA